jgi:acetamidase/formamidase
MKRLPREKNQRHVLDRAVVPSLEVEQGEQFVVETEDAMSGRIRSAADLRTRERMLPMSGFEPPLGNPLAGPIYVRGVSRGDVLAVHIERIVPDSQGVTTIRPGIGALADSQKWSQIHAGEYTHVIRHEAGPSGTTRDGTAVYLDGVRWNMAPFIGTVGVAPEVEVETSVFGQGVWGGNWDCRDIKEGSVVYLNCYNEGALLYLGDVHGTQGDGEWSGTANETRAEVTLSCSAIKNKRIPYARIEKEHSIIALYAARPLEDAVNTAITYLLEWMVEEYNLSPRDAYLRIALNPEFRINVYQLVAMGKLQYTVGAEYPRDELLP